MIKVLWNCHLDGPEGPVLVGLLCPAVDQLEEDSLVVGDVRPGGGVDKLLLFVADAPASECVPDESFKPSLAFHVSLSREY
jgi:hypothetical protein